MSSEGGGRSSGSSGAVIAPLCRRWHRRARLGRRGGLAGRLGRLLVAPFRRAWMSARVVVMPRQAGECRFRIGAGRAGGRPTTAGPGCRATAARPPWRVAIISLSDAPTSPQSSSTTHATRTGARRITPAEGGKGIEPPPKGPARRAAFDRAFAAARPWTARAHRHVRRGQFLVEEAMERIVQRHEVRIVGDFGNGQQRPALLALHALAGQLFRARVALTASRADNGHVGPSASRAITTAPNAATGQTSTKRT